MKYVGRFPFVASAIALLPMAFSCASTRTTGGIVAGQTEVRKGKVVILAVADGKERSGDVAGGSGLAVAAALRDGLVVRGIAPFVTEQTSVAEAVKEAHSLGYDYVLRATITEWEDNATEWSGKPDSAALSVELFDLTPVLVSTATHRKKASSMALSSGTPDRFVPELVQFTILRIFGEKQPSATTPSTSSSALLPQLSPSAPRRDPRSVDPEGTSTTPPPPMSSATPYPEAMPIVATPSPSSPSAHIPEAPAAAATPQEELYYINPGGEAYHRAGCKFITREATHLPLEKAARGRRPCRTCRPPVR